MTHIVASSVQFSTEVFFRMGAHFAWPPSFITEVGFEFAVLVTTFHECSRAHLQVKPVLLYFNILFPYYFPRLPLKFQPQGIIANVEGEPLSAVVIFSSSPGSSVARLPKVE